MDLFERIQEFRKLAMVKNTAQERAVPGPSVGHFDPKELEKKFDLNEWNLATKDQRQNIIANIKLYISQHVQDPQVNQVFQQLVQSVPSIGRYLGGTQVATPSTSNQPTKSFSLTDAYRELKYRSAKLGSFKQSLQQAQQNRDHLQVSKFLNLIQANVIQPLRELKEQVPSSGAGNLHDDIQEVLDSAEALTA